MGKSKNERENSHTPAVAVKIKLRNGNVVGSAMITNLNVVV